MIMFEMYIRLQESVGIPGGRREQQYVLVNVFMKEEDARLSASHIASSFAVSDVSADIKVRTQAEGCELGRTTYAVCVDDGEAVFTIYDESEHCQERGFVYQRLLHSCD